MKIFSYSFLSAVIYAIFMTCCFSADKEEQTVRSEDFNKTIALIQAAEKDKTAESFSAVLIAVKAFSEKVSEEVLLKDPEFIKSATELEESLKNFKSYRDSKIKTEPKLQELADRHSLILIELRKKTADKEKLEAAQGLVNEINEYFNNDPEYIKYKEQEKAFTNLKVEIIKKSSEPIAEEYRFIQQKLIKLITSEPEASVKTKKNDIVNNLPIKQ